MQATHVIISVVVAPPLSMFFFLLRPPPPSSTLFPYTTLFRSPDRRAAGGPHRGGRTGPRAATPGTACRRPGCSPPQIGRDTSELQSHVNLVCRLLLEKKKLGYHTLR